MSLPVDLVRGKRLKVSGYIRTEDVTTGYAAFWLRADGPSGSLSLDNMSAFAPRGTTEWTRYEFERVIDPAVVNVFLGFFLAGRGTARFDDLRLEIDGVPLAQTQPFNGEPTAEHLEWLRTNAIPFTTERAGCGFADLQPLRQVIGNARIVALGKRRTELPNSFA